MRRITHRQGFQAQIAPEAMIRVNHQIAGRQRAGFCDDVGGFLFAARTGQAVAQNILLGDHHKVRRLKPVFQRQDDARNRLTTHLVSGPPVGRLHDRFQAMIAQHAGETVRAAFRPAGEQHALAG